MRLLEDVWNNCCLEALFKWSKMIEIVKKKKLVVRDWPWLLVQGSSKGGGEVFWGGILNWTVWIQVSPPIWQFGLPLLLAHTRASSFACSWLPNIGRRQGACAIQTAQTSVYLKTPAAISYSYPSSWYRYKDPPWTHTSLLSLATPVVLFLFDIPLAHRFLAFFFIRLLQKPISDFFTSSVVGGFFFF